MKLNIVGASNFANRMFEACGPYQWAREFVKNSTEAAATKVEFGIEWQAVQKFGVYRRTIADNGFGMADQELLRFFSKLGEGAKKIGGVHDNFGVGAKIASLPWNPNGVVVVSYHDGIASMIKIVLDSDTGEYELVEFETDGGRVCVIDPHAFDWGDDVDWGKVAPDWIKPHGTIIVLLGSSESPDTVLGNRSAGEEGIKGLSTYLNSRFWDNSSVEVIVLELRSQIKTSWPISPDEKDDAKRPNHRSIQGAKYYLTKVKAPNGVLQEIGCELLGSDRVRCEWYLWKGTRPSVHSYARENGYIAVRYKGELYAITNSKSVFRAFGIIEAKVQQNLTLILEPKLFSAENGKWGVHPDQSRNRLIFSGNGTKGSELPILEWGQEFAQNLPDTIFAAIQAARSGLSGSIDNQEYRKRLQNKFGDRWSVKVNGEAIGEDDPTGYAEATDEIESTRHRRTGQRAGLRNPKKSPGTVVKLRRRIVPGNGTPTIEIKSPVDVPRYRYETAEQFEYPWHVAIWAPRDPSGPTVVLNSECPLIREAIVFHQANYAPVFSEDVQKVVMAVYGEIAACKIAHSQKLSKFIPEEELNSNYRSEGALTIALMGLLGEESVISQRLAYLGRRRAMGELGD